MTDNEVKRGRDGDPRKMIAVAAGSALLIFLAFTFFARTPKARLNVVQIVSLVVFTALILRHGRAEGASLSEPRSEPPSKKGVRWELLLAPILSAFVYAPALSSYFISDDYYTLFAFRSAPFEVLADVAKHGFLGTSYRPAGFVSLIIDYCVWGHDPFVTHLFDPADSPGSRGLDLISIRLDGDLSHHMVGGLLFEVSPDRSPRTVCVGAAPIMRRNAFERDCFYGAAVSAFAGIFRNA
jgi:hypothetical protein